MSEPALEAPTEALQAVLDVLDIRSTGQHAFTGHSLNQLNGRVYGGQVLAQALVAAGRTVATTEVDEPRLPHSVHGYFLRAGDLTEPILFEVEGLRDGGSFSARRTHALQTGRPILSMITSFQEGQQGVEHAEHPPHVIGPEGLPSAHDLFTSVDHPAARFMARTGAFDIRHVTGSIYLPDEHRPAATSQALWMRARGPVGGDQLLQRAVLAYACDQVMLEPVLRRHRLSWTHEDLSVASLDHAMWWHRDVDVTEWLLYLQDAPTAQGGRGLGIARVFTRQGELVATVAQEGMIRTPRR